MIVNKRNLVIATVPKWPRRAATTGRLCRLALEKALQSAALLMHLFAYISMPLWD
jgi:hypothetical protein